MSVIKAIVAATLLLSSLSAIAEPRLIVQITVDGLRADLLQRYQSAFVKQGFKRFMQQGIVYNNAHYLHANTETIVGHTTLATGASPAMHGMIGNAWYDPQKNRVVYNVEDHRYPLLSASAEISSSANELDPSQRALVTDGRSPANMMTNSFSDSLKIAYRGQSKTFAVSVKDRGAIPLAGHTGKAFWYNKNNGQFTTSRYYYDEVPAWLKTFNEQRYADSYAGKHWQLDKDQHYLNAAVDDRDYEADLAGFSRTFPHPFGSKDETSFYSKIKLSPVGDKLTADIAKQIISVENLGSDAIPDYLAVSFSSVDAVNHVFGPSSLENEAVILALDKTLAEFLSFIDDRVGLKHTLLVLSADHGMADMYPAVAAQGYDVGRVPYEDILPAANAFAQKRFGIHDAFEKFYRPYLYLDDEKFIHAQAQNKQLNKQQLIAAVAEHFAKSKGIYRAVASSSPQQNHDALLQQQIVNNHFPGRSGDIYIVQKPYWLLLGTNEINGMHGSPWKYDTHVPLMFAGMKIKSRNIQRLVHPRDIAPTLSAIMGINQPASAQGDVLAELR